MEVQLLVCFGLGCCMGSFVNAFTWRMVRHMDFVWSRSVCPHCAHPLAWFELIPLVSWVLMRGRCRICHQPISLRYVWMELAGGWITLACVLQNGVWIGLIAACILFGLVAIALIDWETMYIYDGMLVVMGIWIVFYILLNQDWLLIQRFFHMILPVLLMRGLRMLAGDCFGRGDIKLVALSGFWLSERIWMALVLALLSGGIYALFLLMKQRATRDTKIPFAPFLAFGMITAFLYSEHLLDWYRYCIIY